MNWWDSFQQYLSDIAGQSSYYRDSAGGLGAKPSGMPLLAEAQYSPYTAEGTAIEEPAFSPLDLIDPDIGKAIFIGAKGLSRLGIDPARDIVGQFSGLWDRAVRAELDDSAARVVPDGFRGLARAEEVSLGDVLESHVYSAYQPSGAEPVLREPEGFGKYGASNPANIKVYYDENLGKGGVLNNNTIGIGGWESLGTHPQTMHPSKNTLNHELQHAIQEREGWARGGSPEALGAELQMAMVKAERRANELKTSPAYKMWVEMRDSALNNPDATTEDVNRAFRYAQENRPPEVVEYQALHDEILNRKQNGLDAYRRLAGEWEARNAGARSVLGADDPRLGNALAVNGVTFRAGSPFSTADDIPLGDMIVRRDGGNALALPFDKLPDDIKKWSIDPEDVGVNEWGGRVVFHGTDKNSADAIVRSGVDNKKSTGGYFGRGFYSASDYNLAKDNYADFAEELPENTSVVASEIAKNARILDLRNPKDWETYQRLGLDKDLWRDNFDEIAMRKGVDGLFDRSFGGLVIYNPKVVKPIKSY